MPLYSPNYYWRLFGTLLSFTTFGVGGLIMGLTVFPIIYILPLKWSTKVACSRFCVRTSFKLFIFMMKSLGVLTYEIHGQDKLNKQGGQLIIANHPSLIDVVFLVSLSGLTNCIVKRGVRMNPCMFFVVRASNYIESRSEDPSDMIDQCVDILKKGERLILFPEGTRTEPDSNDLKLKNGFSHIAIKANQNLTPVYITCHPTTLTRRHRWYNIPHHQPPHFILKVGDDIVLSDIVNSNEEQSRQVRTLTRHIKHVLEKPSDFKYFQTLERDNA